MDEEYLVEKFRRQVGFATWWRDEFFEIIIFFINMKSDDERWYPVDERVSDAGQEGGDVGRLAAAIAFGSLGLSLGCQYWGLPPGGESGFPVRWNGRPLVSAAAI